MPHYKLYISFIAYSFLNNESNIPNPLIILLIYIYKRIQFLHFVCHQYSLKMNSLPLFLILVYFISSPMLAHSIPTFPIWNHVLALTYGVNYCRANPCHGAPINFERITIHGLWPNSRPSKNPLRPQDTLLQYCDLSSQLRARDLSTPITIELKTNWPSITNYQIQGQPLGVWNYEWRKHGICTWFNKEPYFRRALDIYYVVNPDLILTSKYFILAFS